jgi:hypothetical protein
VRPVTTGEEGAEQWDRFDTDALSSREGVKMAVPSRFLVREELSQADSEIVYIQAGLATSVTSAGPPMGTTGLYPAKVEPKTE